MLSRKILAWDDFQFSSNVDVAGSGVWYDLLSYEVTQNNLKKFFAGKGFRLKVPTADQKTSVDADSASSVTVSLTHSIPDITGPAVDYQVQAYVDDTEYPVSSIDATANEVTVDTSDSSNGDADITVFYISDASEQFGRFVVEASTNEYDDFLSDDLGSIHSLDQRNVEEREKLVNSQLAPEFFYVKLQVKSSISYVTDPGQDSDLNDHSIETDLNKLILPHKQQPVTEYINKDGTPGTREAVKEMVIQNLTH